MSWRTIQAMQGLGQSMGDAMYQSRRMKMQKEQAALQQQLGNQQLQESQFRMGQEQELAPLKKQQLQQQVEEGNLKNDITNIAAGGGGESQLAAAGRKPQNQVTYQHEWVPEGRYNSNLGPTQPMPKTLMRSPGDKFDPENKDPLANRYVGPQLLIQKPSFYDKQLTGLEVPPGLVNGRPPGTAPGGSPMQMRDRVNYNPTPRGEAQIGNQGPGLTQEQLPGSLNALNPQMELEKASAGMDEQRRKAAVEQGELGVKQGGLKLGEASLAQNQTQHDVGNKLSVLHGQQAAAMAQLNAALKGDDPAAVNAALDALHKVHAAMGSIVGLPQEAPAEAPPAQPQGEPGDFADQVLQDPETILGKLSPDMEDSFRQKFISDGGDPQVIDDLLAKYGPRTAKAARANEKADRMKNAILDIKVPQKIQRARELVDYTGLPFGGER